LYTLDTPLIAGSATLSTILVLVGSYMFVPVILSLINPLLHSSPLTGILIIKYFTLGPQSFRESLKGSLMQFTLKSTVKLVNGVPMPLLSLGVYLMRPGQEMYQAVKAALETCYRLVDTASFYHNEEDAGRAVRDSALPRDEVFITTKLWNDDHGYDSTLRAFDASLNRLGLGYIDLYLIHFPVPNLRDESWRALEKMLDSGKARAIGVSNYTERHLKDLLCQSSVVPAINQVEFSPFLYQRDLFEFCRKHRIQLEAYAPLTTGRRLDDPRIKGIARKHGRTNAQVLLRWAIQHEVSLSPSRGTPAGSRRMRRSSTSISPAKKLQCSTASMMDFAAPWIRQRCLRISDLSPVSLNISTLRLSYKVAIYDRERTCSLTGITYHSYLDFSPIES
jgi:diketogulonate reductase-like aldo/keto reductase